MLYNDAGLAASQEKINQSGSKLQSLSQKEPWDVIWMTFAD